MTTEAEKTNEAEIQWYFGRPSHSCGKDRLIGWLGPSQKIVVGVSPSGAVRYRSGSYISWKIGTVYDVGHKSHKVCPFCLKPLMSILWDMSFSASRRKCIRCGKLFDSMILYESGRGGPPICRLCVRRRK